jgi:hypothetical protein
MGLADPLGTHSNLVGILRWVGVNIGHSLREMGPLSARKESPDGRVLTGS